MNIFITDAVVLGLLAVSAMFACARGFLREVLGIMGSILAIFVALYGHDFVYPFWQGIFRSPLAAHIASYLSLFMGVLLVFSVSTYRLIKLVDDGALNTMDKAMGLGFGLLRGVVILALSYLIIMSFVEKQEDMPSWLAGAYSTPYIKEAAVVLIALLPNTLEKEAEKTTNLEADPKPPPSSLNKPKPKETEKAPYNKNDQEQLDNLIQDL
jgi:membrane protein required for colicin V production